MLGNRKESESGQASILVGMMMLTFILFFAFVVNTGMLVNAKINLQNAADAAAYAGAATQARLLNQISYLNYDMRRAYKKFLFRYYVVGNMAQDSHPTNGTSLSQTTGPRRWLPDARNPATDYEVPSVCVTFNKQDNYCHVARLRAIQFDSTSQSPLEYIQPTLNEQLKAIENTRQQNCKRNAEVNKMLLSFWLFNTDPDLKAIEQAARNNPTNDPASDQTGANLSVIRGLAFGLGLIPRLVIHRARIATLNDYINEPAQSGVTMGRAAAMLQSPDPAQHERTVQAMLSAYNTLGNHTFDSEDLQLTELLPGGQTAATLLKLENVGTRFDVYAVDFDLTNAQVAGDASRKDCEPRLVPMGFNNPITVGVKKDLKTLTYYAIRLQAKAKVMFSPFGDMTMKAYAAAQPFGSRIGPSNLTEADFSIAGQNQFYCGGINFNNCVGRIPTLPILQVGGGGATGGDDWGKNEFITAFFNQFKVNTGGGGGGQLPPSLGPADMERAYQAAMIPNPWETGKFNIINDEIDDPFIKYFPTPNRIYAFWAPIVSPAKSGGGANIQATINQLIADAIQKPFQLGGPGGGQVGAPPNPIASAIAAKLAAGLTEYFNKLQGGAGEENEGFNVARLVDPYSQRPPSAGAPSPGKIAFTDANVVLSDPAKIRTSWNDTKDNRFNDKGRAGYSVKYVSFSTLMNNTGVYTDGQATTWSNTPVLDPEAAQDIGALQH